MNVYEAWVPAGVMSNDEITEETLLTFDDDAEATLLQAKVQNIYLTVDNTTPSSTNGYTLFTSDSPVRIDLYPGATIKVLHAASGALLMKQDLKRFNGVG